MLATTGISRAVDSCAGLIIQKAARTYGAIPAEHRRWIDLDDVIQDGLLAAVRTNRKWRRRFGTKYSTYLYNGLKFSNDRKYHSRLEQKKRSGEGLVELDAIPDKGPVFQLSDRAALATEQVAAVQGFTEILRLLSVPAVSWLAATLILGKVWPVAREEKDKLSREIRLAANKQGVSEKDLRLLAVDEKARDGALTALENCGRLLSDEDAEKNVLECIECRGMFPVSAIWEHRYFVRTMTCGACYRKLQKADTSCFGKRKTAKAEGYSEADVECRLHCLDRKYCREHLTKQERRKHMEENDDLIEDEEVEDEEVEETAEEAVGDVEFGETPVKVKRVKKTKKAKAVAKAKAAKAPAKAKAKVKTVAKAEKKSHGHQKPKKGKKNKAVGTHTSFDVVWPYKGLPEGFPGGEWPFREGSVLLYVFQRCLKGAKRSELENHPLFKKLNYKWSFMFKVMENGSNVGAPRAADIKPKHIWKLNQEGGRLKIYNVKFVGDKAKAKKTVKAKSKAKAKAAKAA